MVEWDKLKQKYSKVSQQLFSKDLHYEMMLDIVDPVLEEQATL